MCGVRREWEPEARRMEPLSRQEKLSTSLARLNGNTAGQEGERPPGCRHGGPAGLPSVASVCWRFRESSDLRGDCVFPWRGLSWGVGPRRPAACEVVLCISPWVAWALPSPHPPTELQMVQRQPQRRQE